MSGWGTALADPAYSSEAVQAAFLYRFAAYVQWPDHVPAPQHFTFAVLCGDPVADQLAHLLPNRPVKDLPAQIKRLASVADLGDSQMLYIGPGCSQDMRRVLDAVSNKPVLVVTDGEEGFEAGADINFQIVGGHMRFEVSLEHARRTGLTVSSGLLSVATRVIGGLPRTHAGCQADEAAAATLPLCMAPLVAAR